MGFGLKTNTNPQLGLGLRKVIKLSQNQSTETKLNQTKPTSQGLVCFGSFNPNLVGSVFITYNTNYIGSIHFLKTVFVRILKY